eukprot:scaffold183092_cov18-Tisochrysis_lutea.AAC.1
MDSESLCVGDSVAYHPGSMNIVALRTLRLIKLALHQLWLYKLALQTVAPQFVSTCIVALHTLPPAHHLTGLVSQVQKSPSHLLTGPIVAQILTPPAHHLAVPIVTKICLIMYIKYISSTLCRCTFDCATSHWRHVDLSYNNVGAGAAMVLGSLAKKLAEASARRILKNSYAQGWDPEVQAGFIDYSGWFEPDPIHGHHNGLQSRGAMFIFCGNNEHR